ncbi:NADH-quinone oxidoreductase subunit J family protein [Thermopirellula anaerolimosa]
MDWNWVFFIILAAITVTGAVSAVVTTHIVRMAFYLVVCLGAVAGLFFLAGAYFVAAMQLMIYVGGTVVLIAFGVMLTARTPFVRMQTSPDQWLLALVTAATLSAVLLQANLRFPRPIDPRATAAEPAVSPGRLGSALLGLRIDAVSAQSDAEGAAALGLAYLLPFELVSVHLLTVLIGAAYLARPRRPANTETEGRREVASEGTGGPQTTPEPLPAAAQGGPA